MTTSSQPAKNWMGFLLNVVSPAIVAIALFVMLIFAVVLPAMKRNIIERKKEMLKELTLTIFSEIKDLHRQEIEGTITRAEAQSLALKQIENARYGDEGKDYFWIQDMHPRMVMHPYRRDLNGKDITHYADPAGKRLFFEFVQLVREHREGYVEYLWQWKDDERRIVPKLSYVKEFEPWGWIIGTGVYLEDVRQEVSEVIRKVLWLSLVIAALIALLLAYIASHSFAIEVKRQRAAQALRESEEKYRLLVESNTVGVALVVDDLIAFANRTLLEMLGYTEKEVFRLAIDEILVHLAGERPGSGNIPDHVRLQGKGGREIDVIATSSQITLEEKAGQIFTFKDISRHTTSEDVLSQMLSELQTSLLMPNTPVAEFQHGIVECGINTAVKRAAEIMTEAASGAILVRGSDDGEYLGIVTDRDMRERVAAAGLDLARPVFTVMSAPLICIPGKSLLFEATLALMDKGIHHLAVTGESGRVTGMISAKEILLTQRHPASMLIKGIQEAHTRADVVRRRQALPMLAKALLENGAKAENVTRTLSLVSDAVTRRLIDFAIERLGTPPLRFTFIVFGSEAREEQTLKTDQDNGLLYEDPAPAQCEAAQSYFLQLGTLVCDWLNEAGYSYCRGDVMAKNPKWCQPAARWHQYFSDCVNADSPQDILDVNVFLDFRPVYGEALLTAGLRAHLDRLTRGRHEFFFHLAANTLQYKPPLGFFGNIQLESEAQTPAFNIKSAAIPIMNFARVYALSHGIEELGTLPRLQKLLALGILVRTSFEELVQAFSFLTQMRLRHQAICLGAGKAADNLVGLEELTQIEQSMLKKIFSDILVFQARLGRDFARTV